MVTPTAAQLRIRDHHQLDLLVIAPAGCGKTEALALRLAGFVHRGIVPPPQRVLVTTFSNRARDNIRDRLRSYLGPGLMRGRVSIVNFHGLSARIFKAHAASIGLEPNLLIPDSDWVGQQCRHRKLSFDAARAAQDTLRIAKQRLASDADVQKSLIASGNPNAIAIEALRISENRLTYDDLPRLAELILANDRIAKLYGNHFAAVVVDEFQDLTPQQLRIVNRIGLGKTTYAGDLAQGIYGFAGAKPTEIDRQVRAECSTVIEFSESHRSSPAVLRLVNSLVGLTGGQPLTSANPTSWPGNGLAAGVPCATTEGEAEWVIAFARKVLENAPTHRVGILARTGPRRRFVDAAVEASGLPYYRWHDGVLDTDTARIVKAMLATLNVAQYQATADPLLYLRQLAGVEAIQDPSIREALDGALNWCCDLIQQGNNPAQVRSRIRIGDGSTLLNVPGVHLLTGHVGKGQQFDWVIVVGAEDGCIPDFRAKDDPAALAEEARILSVMISRARHGVVVTNSSAVPAGNGAVYDKRPTRFWPTLAATDWADAAGVSDWLAAVDWDAIRAR